MGLGTGEVSILQLTIDHEEVVLVVGLTRDGSVPSMAKGGEGAGVDGRKRFMVTLFESQRTRQGGWYPDVSSLK